MKIKRWLFLIAGFYFFTASGSASAERIMLRWHANVETDLQGYNVYYGTQSKSYSPPIRVGNTTEHILQNIEAGKTYFFAVTAVDRAGNESAYSSESSIVIPEENDNAPAVSVTSSAEESGYGNIAVNTTDNDLTTRWSADGSGQWIQYDLGAIYNIYEVTIAFYRGDTRTADFEIFVSDDAQSWESVFRGQSSGTTQQPEYYRITDATGRFVRIVGYGNSDNTWNSITEVDIVGELHTLPTAFTWTGAINSDWEESDNWDVGEVPSDGTDVAFPANCPLAIHSNASGTSRIDQLSCSGQLIISGGSLTIDGDARIK